MSPIVRYTARSGQIHRRDSLLDKGDLHAHRPPEVLPRVPPGIDRQQRLAPSVAGCRGRLG